MEQIPILYSILSYIIMAGVLWEENSSDNMVIRFIQLLFAPILVPVMLGVVIGKVINK